MFSIYENPSVTSAVFILNIEWYKGLCNNWHTPILLYISNGLKILVSDQRFARVLVENENQINVETKT